MRSSSKRVFFRDHVFAVDENVYEPAEDSFLLAESLFVHGGDRVLDMGTGCGMLAVEAAAKGASVVAVDISPYAVRCAKSNARLNGVGDRVFPVQGDLFAPLKSGAEFDHVFFNAPYLPSKKTATSWLERAWNGGPSGRQIIDRFTLQVSEHLGRNGQVFLLQSTLCGVDETLRKFEAQGLAADVVAERSLPFFETIVLVKARRRTAQRVK